MLHPVLLELLLPAHLPSLFLSETQRARAVALSVSQSCGPSASSVTADMQQSDCMGTH